MGEQHQIAADLVADRASATTDPVRNLRTGMIFWAEIDGAPDPILLATELGEDARNVILLHVNSDVEAAQINMNDECTFTLFGALVRCQILKRRDSGAQAQTDFWAMQLTPKDQA